MHRRKAATHWAADRDFRRRYPDVLLDTEPIYVKDGNLYTSAGVTSILDLMLALVEEDFGSELALRVAQGLVMFLRRPANQSQFSVPLTGLKTDDEKIRDVVSHIAKNPGSDLTVEGSGETFTVNGTSNIICGNVQTANATVYLLDGVLWRSYKKRTARREQSDGGRGS